MTDTDQYTCQYTCAVWYIDGVGQADYELFSTEDEAAQEAVSFEYYGTTLGLQRADGTQVSAADWPMFTEALDARRRAETQRRDNPPPIPARPVRDPFRNIPVDVEASAPDWLGR